MKTYQVTIDGVTASVEANDEGEAINAIKALYGVAYASRQSAVVVDPIAVSVVPEAACVVVDFASEPTKPTRKTRKGQ